MRKIILAMMIGNSLFSTSNIQAKTMNEQIIPAIAGVQSKALLLGFAKNQYDLGMAYYDGQKIPRNTSKAIEWLNLASEKNYAPAKVVLAKMLLSGDGVNPNPVLATRLLQQAASNGNQQAKQMLEQTSNTPSASQIAQQYSAFDQALLCQGWYTKNMTQPSFLEQMARDEIEGKAHKNIEIGLKQTYQIQDTYRYYPEYKDAYADTPYVQIFLPRNAKNALFKKLEFTNHYGYGFNFEGVIQSNADIAQLKNLIENRDKIQLRQFDAEQFNRDLKAISSLQLRQNYDASSKITEKLFTQFKNSYLVHDDNLQSLYFASKPRGSDDYGGFAEYIYLTKSKNGEIKVICGVGQ